MTQKQSRHKYVQKGNKAQSNLPEYMRGHFITTHFLKITFSNFFQCKAKFFYVTFLNHVAICQVRGGVKASRV